MLQLTKSQSSRESIRSDELLQVSRDENYIPTHLPRATQNLSIGVQVPATLL